MDLNVHLQGSNAMLGARHFEVHIAQVVLKALDIAQNCIAQSFAADRSVGHQAHGNARDRRFDRHTRIHQGQGAAAYRRHRRRAVGR